MNYNVYPRERAPENDRYKMELCITPVNCLIYICNWSFLSYFTLLLGIPSLPVNFSGFLGHTNSGSDSVVGGRDRDPFLHQNILIYAPWDWNINLHLVIWPKFMVHVRRQILHPYMLHGAFGIANLDHFSRNESKKLLKPTTWNRLWHLRLNCKLKSNHAETEPSSSKFCEKLCTPQRKPFSHPHRSGTHKI